MEVHCSLVTGLKGYIIFVYGRSFFVRVIFSPLHVMILPILNTLKIDNNESKVNTIDETMGLPGIIDTQSFFIRLKSHFIHETVEI